TTADLVGRVTPLFGPVTSLQLDAIGPAAQLDVAGNLGPVTVNRDVTLGPGGHITVANDLSGPFLVNGALTVDGGQFAVSRDVTGAFAVSRNLSVLDGGRLTVGRNLGLAVAGAGLFVGGDLILKTGGSLAVAGNLNALSVTGGVRGEG